MSFFDSIREKVKSLFKSEVSMQEIEQLIENLGGFLMDESLAAKDKLVKIGEPAVMPLINALDDNAKCSYAAWALGEIGNKRAIDPLIENIEDSDPKIVVVIEALGKFKDDEKAKQALHRLLDLESEDNKAVIRVVKEILENDS